MTFRYWLALLYVALFLDVPCEAYNNRLQGHSEQASDSPWAQLGWPALPNFRSPYRRAYHSLSSRLYPQWPLPAVDGMSDHHARWPSARPAQAPSRHRVHQTQADRHHAASSWTEQSVRSHQSSHTVHRPHQTSHTMHRSHQPSHTVHRTHHSSRIVDRVVPQPAPSITGETRSAVLPAHHYTTGRRPGQQWVLPRRFLTSPDSGRGRGTIPNCQDGKVWQNGKCECPYLSNWSEDNKKCECVYGTYRHVSGHCRSY